MSGFPYIPSPQPFWFVDSELLTDVLRAEIRAVNQFTASEPALRSLFDSPEATVSQRKVCFTVLAHRKILEMIYDKFTGLYEPSPALGEEESKAVDSTNGLVTGDAPNWVLEMDRVVEQLPAHIFSALPKPLHAGGFAHGDAAKMEAIQSAANTLGTVDQIQGLIEKVLNQQLERLARRWTVPAIETHHSKKRKPRTRDRLRVIRDREIAEIDDISPTITEFLKLMDERKVKPQPTWSGWPGSWTKAYMNPRLRALIHKDKSRALSRARHEK